MLTNTEDFVARTTLLLLVTFFLTGCASTLEPGEHVQCSYTWKKTQDVASIITIRQEKDWRLYPGTCRVFEIKGCASTSRINGKLIVDILTIDDPDELSQKNNECSSLNHEIKHALGYTHKERHFYTPQDFTRR